MVSVSAGSVASRDLSGDLERCVWSAPARLTRGNATLYGNGGIGVARINSPGKISVARDGTITCEIAAPPAK